VLYSIQVLRFIAAMAVTCHHSWPLPFDFHVGAAGVDVFFVISGLVIGLMPETESPGRFFLKRLIRIYPFYWISALFHQAFKYYVWHESSIPTLDFFLRSMFLIPDNISLIQPHNDFLPIYFVAWTLIYEMFFYIIYTIFLPLFRRKTNFVCAAVVAGLSFTPLMGANNGLLLEFASGLMIAEMVRREWFIPPQTMAVGLIVFAVAMLCYYHKLDDFALPLRNLTWGIPAVCFVLGFLGLEKLPLFRHPFLQFGGGASYAIYVLHLTVTSFVLVFCEWHEIPVATYYIPVFCASVLGSMALGFLSHRFIERPIIAYLRWRLLSSRVVGSV